MNLLILLEDEKYLPLVRTIENNELIGVEVNNIDFKLDNAIKRAEVVLFLGDDLTYETFKSEYKQLLNTKLVITTTEVEKHPFEVAVTLFDGVIVCRVQSGNDELRAVIIEVLAKIFDESLKQLISDELTYQDNIERINNLQLQLKGVIASDLQLPDYIVQQLITNFKI